ncbi:VPS10 domain-containing receptor SorCS1-like isoform X2 [Mercenaria mercenaria]|uniref:VPS10 domain-containing receptor SorCS1-like isoform X2 n=1 Tax=Mercenaria mercenaria TaxID=6596 RepID=UPI001E1E05FA|nr:VPS10 domain-containing receptor SorCS1-like isoform X2 [Mercenaria mercenaria]
MEVWSIDYGESYSKINLPQLFTVSYMYSSLADKSKIILSDLIQRQLYITEDTGQTWKHVKLNFSPYRILLHPSIANFILAYSLREMKLYVSKDFGATWKLMMERVTERFFWAVDGVDHNPNIVHMELQDPMGPVTYFACIAPNCDKAEYDKTLGTIDFYSLVVENEYIFVQKSTDDLTSFFVSYKRGPFKRAYFPSNLTPLDFNIVDTSDHQVFIAVDHEEDIANLYLSDVTGQFYVMSVENVVGLRYPGKFDVDLVKVKGLNGIYIINKFETSRVDGGVFSQRTYITFNKGGMWKLLSAPEESKQNCMDTEKCNLHLHIGNTNQFFRIPMAVCTEEAPGLILAHGSVGEFLDMDSHVFISRDAGFTWKAAPFKGNHFLNIMDQGSAISAVAAHGLPTNQVHFSCTEGASWVTHNITSSEMNVDGVVNEPGIKTLISSVFGHMNSSNGWVMVKMDFGSVLDRKCGFDDFELWQPSADLVENNVRCIMGENVVYERRKQLSECYYGADYFRPKSAQICSCEREDFECDFGYDVGTDGTTCIKSAWFKEDQFPGPHCINGKYNHSKGYRKVAASKCNGGKESKYLPVETDCPLLAPRGITIYSEKKCIQRGVNVTFRLTQESGSADETVYTWTFGNESSPVTIKGLHNAASITTSFSTIGKYNITVLAVNSKGTAQAVLPIHVEEGLKGVLVEIPWGARTGMPSYFNVTVLGSDNITKLGKEQSLHFAWHFENKMTGDIRQLTWQNVIQQEFNEPGEYKLTLNVFNSVSSVFYTQSVEVYDDMTTVRLHFSEEINNYNSSSLNVRQALAEILCHNLAQILEIRRSRIIMSVPPTQPVVGDLTVLPPKRDINETETYQVVEMLIDQAKQQYLAFPLFTSDDIVIITDAGILDLRTGAESSTIPPPPATVTVMVPVHVNVTTVQEKHSLVAVYISVPVLISVIGLAVAIIFYYRKKLKSHKKYYPIVKHRSRIHHDSTCSCGEEDILGLEDPDDSIIPDSEYPDNQPTLMILNEPRSSRTERSPDRVGLVNC